MASNQEKLDGAFWAVTQEGRDFADRHTFSETKYPNAWGHPFTLLEILNGVERRVQEQNAITSQLISALAAVSKGEPFDEAKLLEGVKAAAESGVKNAIENITVTVKGE